MFFVISGYCSPDNYTSNDGPVLRLREFKTVEEVEAARQAFFEVPFGREHSDVTFRVIEGVERKFVPVEKVTKYELA